MTEQITFSGIFKKLREDIEAYNKANGIMTEQDKTRDHLTLFLYRVFTMREQQKKYDQGDYKAKVIAKRMEAQVDNAINKLVTELGYNMGEITKKYEQAKLL